MTLRKLLLSVIVGATFVACGSSDSAAKETNTKPEMTQVKEGESIVYTLNSTISPDKQLPTVIDFSATWCGPCRRFAPIFEETAKEYKGKAIFMSVDVDNSPETARQFEVSAIPQVSILMPDGTITSTVGFMDKDQFVDFISKAVK
ncbi:thioredoxin domain-containing protein [uncultured Duncaniella sp.]|uniref:thioredoxin family protein n=1 Tax=uncultured Duncaniella sp. TaxID=2768039 RepID=UPI00259D1C44|nr:thioredoxin domain-containing protein [uncultured Duncaniella sp.]